MHLSKLSQTLAMPWARGAGETRVIPSVECLTLDCQQNQSLANQRLEPDSLDSITAPPLISYMTYRQMLSPSVPQLAHL